MEMYNLKFQTESEVQQWLVNLWSSLFGTPNEMISIDSNFFELGGNSLTLINFLSTVDKAIGADLLSPKTVFTKPLLGELAKEIFLLVTNSLEDSR